jgi:hypothetical protein
MRNVLDGSGFKLEDLPIQKKQRAERLVLCRRADLPFNCKVREVPIVAHAAFDLTALAMIYWNLESKVAHLVFK